MACFRCVAPCFSAHDERLAVLAYGPKKEFKVHAAKRAKGTDLALMTCNSPLEIAKLARKSRGRRVFRRDWLPPIAAPRQVGVVCAMPDGYRQVTERSDAYKHNFSVQNPARVYFASDVCGGSFNVGLRRTESDDNNSMRQGVCETLESAVNLQLVLIANLYRWLPRAWNQHY